MMRASTPAGNRLAPGSCPTAMNMLFIVSVVEFVLQHRVFVIFFLYFVCSLLNMTSLIKFDRFSISSGVQRVGQQCGGLDIFTGNVHSNKTLASKTTKGASIQGIGPDLNPSQGVGPGHAAKSGVDLGHHQVVIITFILHS